ncbi:hypothetical protein AB833_21325 [Chromatiales bacterium (ex Bugula neritina AB1)]|nr:hypothetical protein AB833_21325 [Chromatiales bacterium (ex Bugula neritina AB1)]
MDFSENLKRGAASPEHGRAPRVLFYSHDTFGLGHLRRSRTMAAALTASDEQMSAMIITGSPVAGRFTFPERVDYVRLPGVTKRSDGSYVSEKLGFDVEETTVIRAGLIKALVKLFVPDIIVVDKEPTGFRGELRPALEWLHKSGNSKLILGLRDVLDGPELLAEEWERKGAAEAMEKYYDEIWVYGLKSVYDPTDGLDLPEQVRKRMIWTGYLRRESTARAELPDQPYILVTPGGGGDGKAMVDQVLLAYEKDPALKPAALLVYGPFLTGDVRSDFERRVAELDGRVMSVGFDSRMESLMAGAAGVVAMGGYNTFCEILSCDVPAVIVPRTVPRLEQYIRASRAEQLGLVRMFDKKLDGSSVDSMIEVIRNLPSQKPPSSGRYAGLLGGLDCIVDRTRALLTQELEAEEA